MPAAPLTQDQLRRRFDLTRLRFATTDDLPDLARLLGQDRALQSLRFGTGIDQDGYNMFAVGSPGTGKHVIVTEYLQHEARRSAAPDDWCYVNNFADPQRPDALRLPRGRAVALRDAMAQLIDDLKTAIPAAFESDDYVNRRQMLESQLRQRHEEIVEQIQERARAKSIALMQTPMGLVFTPVKDGEVLNPEAFAKLPDTEQAGLKTDIEALQAELQQGLRQLPMLEKEVRDRLRTLNQEVTQRAAGHLIAAVRTRFADLPSVLAYLDTVEKDVVNNALDFIRPLLPPREPPQGAQAAMAAAARENIGPDGTPFGRYRVNVLVDNAAAAGAPVVFEDNPVLGNIIGRIEHTAMFGTLVTDFNLIKPGALHKANGGYLILDARKVLMQAFSWEELKRALSAKRIRTQTVGEIAGMVQTVSLEPEPIPLDVKIVLVGDRMLHMMLSAHDPDFPALFKVQADFDDRVDISDDMIDLYVRLIATLARRAKTRPLDPGGVERLLEYAARAADDRGKLTMHLRSLIDVMHEADYWAAQSHATIVTRDHVEKAIAHQIYRSDRVREAMHEQITEGTMFIDTDGAVIGQVNALSVLQLGGFMFGKPSRITARVRVGRGEVVDIERRVELGGPLHSKGVLILSSFLGATFAADRPLSLTASLVFEQSYGGVDGDSASSTELYALLSALAEAPIEQCFAVTGSVNQFGQVQPIGGVNEKIEGFFDICRGKGLTGKQGVLIPASNVRHLMLRQDVVDACAAGKFRIHPVASIAEGIELLTGIPAGVADADGKYPPDSIYGRVTARLDRFAATARRFAGTKSDAGEDADATAKG